MTSPTPEHLPPDHRFREYQDPHYHDEDEQPGSPTTSDEIGQDRKPVKRPGSRTPKFARPRRFEED